jgi:hypothetical protein
MRAIYRAYGSGSVFRMSMFAGALLLLLSAPDPAFADVPDRGVDEGATRTPRCKALTDSCAVCSDRKIRTFTPGTRPESGVVATISPYACALRGKSAITAQTGSNVLNVALKARACAVLSSFCAACEDGKFIFTKDGAQIQSDPYECATEPRSRGTRTFPKKGAK